MSDCWTSVDAALHRAGAAGRRITVWLRDDDAVTVTPALDRLTAAIRRHDAPMLLAVIPQGADRRLAAHVAAEPLFTPAQHGFAHHNHAHVGERACEIGGARPLAVVHDDLRQGRDLVGALFGPAAADVLVPPWNRIAPAVLPSLPELGYGALSTFANANMGTAGLDVVNSTLDIIDWRNARRCHPATKLAERLAGLIDADQPIGVLTHHLVHDEEAWHVLDQMLGHLVASPQVAFLPFAAMRGL